jgi:hypothetical protein
MSNNIPKKNMCQITVTQYQLLKTQPQSNCEYNSAYIRL